MKVLATIELDDNQGRGELYWHENGDIWCRRVSSGEHWPTQLSYNITSETHAIKAIGLAWDGPAWNLEWVDNQ